MTGGVRVLPGLRGRWRPVRVGGVIFAAAVAIAGVAFGVWAIVTQDSAAFGRLTWLAGALSMVVAAAVAAAGMSVSRTSTHERRLPSPRVARTLVPLPGSSGLGTLRGQLVGDIPREPRDFQPRPDLLAALDHAAPGVSLLHGPAGIRGVGTTELAAEYARARIAAGWWLVAWVNAEDTGILLAGLAAVADAAGLSGDALGQAADAGLVVRHQLEADGDRCLIVFDNASDPDVVRPFVPAAGAARVLVTGSWPAEPNLGTSVLVDVFTEREAVAFLTRRTGLDDAAGASAVAADLGYLPLALAQAAAVITGQHLDYWLYLKRLRALPVEEYLIRGQGEPYPPRSAEAVLMSLDEIWAADQAGVCTRVMEIMAVLSAAGVRRDVLYAAGRAGILVSEDGDGVAADLVDRSLELLAERSLLTLSLNGQTVIAHRLVTRVVRDGLIRQKRLMAACRSAGSVLKTRAEALKGSRDRTAIRDIPRQVMALLEIAAGSGVETSEELARLLLSLRMLALYHLTELDDSAPQAIAVGEPLIADLERVLGPDHPDTLTARDRLAAAYHAAGRVEEALPLYERTLADRERVLGPNHPATLASRDNVAAAYQGVGRAEEAIPLHEQALAARERILGPEHPDTVASRDSLATAYRDVGRAEEAIPLHEQALAARERVLGPGHPDTLASRDNLAVACWAAGRAAEAIPLLKRVLAARERVLGPGHPGTLASRSNLAVACWAAGRAEEAISLHQQALAARERVLGPGHPDTLTSRNNLAVAYVDAGRADEAIPLLAQTLADRERVLGPSHPRTRTSRNNLAIARSRRSKRSVASANARTA